MTEPQEAIDDVDPVGEGGEVDGVGGPEVLMGEATTLLHPLLLLLKSEEERRRWWEDDALAEEEEETGSMARLKRSIIAS